MPKVNPFNCLHRNIHPARFDGTHTACFDCEQTVSVTTTFYASGVPMAQQYTDAIERLNKIRTEELRAELVAHEAQNTKAGE